MAKGTKTGGRVKGTPNRFTSSMKDAFLSVYQDLQDENGEEHGHLKAWAKDHPTDFYKICSKMIPQQLTADVNYTVSAKEMTDEELLNIATGGSARGTGAKKGQSEPSSVH